jgi:cold shock CspA family protein
MPAWRRHVLPHIRASAFGSRAPRKSASTGGSDVFVHIHDVEAAGMKLLAAGQLVTYEVGRARDGRSKAVNLRLLER